MKTLITATALATLLAAPLAAGPLSDAFGGSGGGTSGEEASAPIGDGTLREKVDGWREAASAAESPEKERTLTAIFAAHE
ncbi:hypothetical protein [Vannielia litorea]|uniref:hypothetical protein n=1 Tax=Vannielia litorea TaxID=1217970 RepID=UPI001BCB9C29|nr:hypothetical protein [Vannielia litorea]MBS8228170.1 hypothetical protein [Vannielia litorea]